MAKAKRRKIPSGPWGETGPTQERWRRGDVEVMTQTIADDDGRPARPFRTIDTLAAMERRRTITPAMQQAGEDFRVLFMLASLDPLHALDPARVPLGRQEAPMTLRQAEARKKVWQALQLLGGIASPSGSCVWHVIGCDWTLKDWALRAGWSGRALSQETASGILLGALGVLQAHYGL